MTDIQLELLKEVGEVWGTDNPEAHASLREKIMEQSMSAEEMVAYGDKLATDQAAAQKAGNDIVLSDVKFERMRFRAWMRAQGAAEQGDMFKRPVPMGTIHLGEKE